MMLFAACINSGFAQTVSSQKGLTTAVFNLPAGIIKVYLPDDIRPGDMISGSVLAAPFGKNAKQTAKNLTELKKYTVEFNGQKIPVAEAAKSFQCTIDKSIQPQRTLNLMNGIGENAGFVNIQPVNNVKTQPAPAGCKIPTHALTEAPLKITGPFDGNSSNTRCMVSNQPCEVIAESPRQCQVSYPKNAKGDQTIEVQENKQSKCVKKISGVELNVMAGRTKLMSGEQTYLEVSVTGLQQLPDTAKLSLVNITTDVVNMEPSNDILILLTPGNVGTGTYTRRFVLQSIKTGSFTVNVNLDLPDENPVLYNFDLRDLKNESGYPGSYGYMGDKPCEPEGKTITWRWHKTFACEIDARKVLMCGHTKEGADVLEKLKELLKELEMDKATDISEKMAKAFSTAKMFSYSIHVIRKWVDYDIYYKCVNGKWQPYGGVYILHGTENLKWHNVNHPTTECWMTFDSPAAEKEFETALENTLRMVCK
jgi:hypothetical protein